MRRMLTLLVLFTSLLTTSGCGYNAMQSQDEEIKATWSERTRDA